MTGVAVTPISGEMSPLLVSPLGTVVTVPPWTACSKVSFHKSVPLSASRA